MEPNLIAVRHMARFAVSIADYGAALHHHTHSHDEPILTLLISGQAEEVVARSTVLVQPFAVGFKPADLRHADRFGGEGVRALRITLDASMLSAAEEGAGGTFEWTWLPRSSAVAPLMRMAARLSRSPIDDFEAEDDLQEALAVLGRDRHCPVPRRDPPTWLATVREQLDDGDDSRLSELARHAGVHPVYLARRFRCHFGCSVDEYVRWRRTAAAAALFRRSNRTIAQVAAEVGCSDQPHLTRLVRAAAGVTPATLRGLVRFCRGGPQVQDVQDSER